MPRRRVEVTAEQFFGLLNARDDLTVVVHGLSSLDAAMDQALEQAFKEQGLQGDLLMRLGVVEKADALILAGKLDPEVRDLLVHLTGIRNRFAHRLQTNFTAAEGRRAFDLLPDPHKGRTFTVKRMSPPEKVIRWCFAVLWARIRNRAVYGNDARVPWA